VRPPGAWSWFEFHARWARDEGLRSGRVAGAQPRVRGGVGRRNGTGVPPDRAAIRDHHVVNSGHPGPNAGSLVRSGRVDGPDAAAGW